MSEFRQDPVSGDWVIISPGRAQRPHFLDSKKKRRLPAPKAGCPFEDLQKSGNWPPLAIYPSAAKWRLAVFVNKYPALAPGKECSVESRQGMYLTQTGVGGHELLVTRDHNKNFAELSAAEAVQVLKTFQERTRGAAANECIEYVVLFGNWGPTAGASVWHPHYQILALPIVPAHSARSLAGARTYFQKKHRCVRCVLIAAEQKEKTRVIAENKRAIALAPFASKTPFEVRIMPKKHAPYFYKTPAPVIKDVAALLQSILKRLKQKVNDPDFNFFIHEAPVDGRKHDYHHWHVELLPRVSVLAGFEESTGIYINVFAPEAAAAILRGQQK